jgi:hypothetical protein
MRKITGVTLLFVYLIAAYVIEIKAGPPFQTDNPQPVEYHAGYVAYQFTIGYSSGAK